MLLDFLARAYVPHLVFGVIAAVVCAYPKTPWPDETWAKPYADLYDRHQDAQRRVPECRPGSDEWVQAERERGRLQREVMDFNARLGQGRAPVYADLFKRTAILALLVGLCYLLTDSLVSCGDGLCLLPDGRSFLLLSGCAAGGGLLTAMLARSDPRLAVAAFLFGDGMAVTYLLFEREAFGQFEAAVLEAERQEEDHEAELRGGTSGAQREAQAFFAANRDTLGDAFPAGLFRSSLNAAIPEGTSAAQAWKAAEELIERMRRVAEANREREGRERKEREREQEERDRVRREREEAERRAAERARTHVPMRPDGV